MSEGGTFYLDTGINFFILREFFFSKSIQKEHTSNFFELIHWFF